MIARQQLPLVFVEGVLTLHEGFYRTGEDRGSDVQVYERPASSQAAALRIDKIPVSQPGVTK